MAFRFATEPKKTGIEQRVDSAVEAEAQRIVSQYDSAADPAVLGEAAYLEQLSNRLYAMFNKARSQN